MERYIFLLSNGTSFVNFDAILRKLQLFSDGRLEGKNFKRVSNVEIHSEKNKFVSDVYVLLRSNVLSLSQQCMVISFSFVLSLYSKNIAEVIYKDHT